MATNPTERGSRGSTSARRGSGAAAGRASVRGEGARSRHSSLGERFIAGVPARIMAPRIVFILCVVAIVAFGVLMVYSSSAIMVASGADPKPPSFYLTRQGIFAFAGAIIAIIIACVPMSFYTKQRVFALWALSLLALFLVLAMGSTAGGAQRWIDLGFFALQPSELVKPFLILSVATVLAEFFERYALDTRSFLLLLGAAVIAPLALVMAQPDYGTTIIIVATVFCMMVLAGASLKFLLLLLFIGVAALGVLFLLEPYRLARFQVLLDPWADPYGDGYQATLGIIAFASGGLFGRGVGNATMKYGYIPELHNDFILANIGEEVGFVGTVVLFALFVCLVLTGFMIAHQGPSMRDRLTAYGCTIIIGVQFLVNILGVLVVLPMTGKTLPFISYGGSSMLASFMLVGYVLRVSVESGRRSVYDERRADFAVVSAGGEGSDQDAVSSHMGRSTAGSPRRRSEATRARSGFSVMDGRRDESTATRPRPREDRSSYGSYDRINLNDNPSERLRSRDSGPRVRRGGTGPQSGSRGRGSDSYSSRRGRYDR